MPRSQGPWYTYVLKDLWSIESCGTVQARPHSRHIKAPCAAPGRRFGDLRVSLMTPLWQTPSRLECLLRHLCSAHSPLGLLVSLALLRLCCLWQLCYIMWPPSNEITAPSVGILVARASELCCLHSRVTGRAVSCASSCNVRYHTTPLRVCPAWGHSEAHMHVHAPVAFHANLESLCREVRSP